MSGKNKLFKADTVLFNEGDPSDGMYIIRSGKLKVYHVKDGKESTLAFLDGGSVIGEMAFFENKPRSASVKAVEESEVTVVDEEDFQKLLKQVPGWFVKMMTSLSGRLRATNERLKAVEEGQSRIQSYPLHDVARITTLISLIGHKDAVKEDNQYQIVRKQFRKIIEEIFNDDYDKINKIVAVYEKFNFIRYDEDSYRNEVVVFENRALFYNYVKYLQEFVLDKNNLDTRLSNEALDLMDLILEISKESTYESMTLSLSGLKKEAQQRDIKTDNWDKAILQLVDKNMVKRVNQSSADVGIRCGKKDVSTLLTYHKMIKAFYDAGLS